MNRPQPREVVVCAYCYEVCQLVREGHNKPTWRHTPEAVNSYTRRGIEPHFCEAIPLSKLSVTTERRNAAMRGMPRQLGLTQLDMNGALQQGIRLYCAGREQVEGRWRFLFRALGDDAGWITVYVTDPHQYIVDKVYVITMKEEV